METPVAQAYVRPMRPRLTYPNVVATICLVAVVIGGSAIAATQSATSTTVNACVVKKGKKAGQLRIITGKKKCKKKTEKKLSWNQKGVAGATGATGATGPAGAAGTNGADAIAPAGAV